MRYPSTYPSTDKASAPYPEKIGCCVGSYCRELADTPNLLAGLTKAAFKTQLATAKTRKSKVVGDDADIEVGRRTLQTLTWEQWA
eukprot:scaffold74099_cov53-Cyclotella_meneghiniana.AAC.1